MRNSHLSLDFLSQSRISSARHAECAEPHEQLRVHRRADVDHHRSGRNQPNCWRRQGVLSPQREPTRRGPHCPNARDVVAAGFAMVGHVQVEYRDQLEL